MNKYPVIKIVLFFITGILAEKFFPLGSGTGVIALLSILFIAIIIFFVFRKKGEVVVSLLILSGFTLAGAVSYSIHNDSLKSFPFPKEKYNHSIVFGRIVSIELLKEGRIVFNADLDSVLIDSHSFKLRHEFIIRIYDEDFSLLKNAYERISIGDRFVLKGTIQQARNERNPGEFDYRKYLYQNGISGLATTYSTKDFNLIDKAVKSFTARIKGMFHSMRKGIDNQTQKYHQTKESALLRGLLLGDYKKIDEESLENFINAGVVHVLAVSGQHVALILLIFFFLFNRFNPYVKYSLAAIGLIMFLFITGNQISVERAVIMGLVFITAVLFNRDRNVFNILALSALIILILSPNELFSPGFQLSYSAVFSIIYIYPILKDFLESISIKPVWLKKIILFAAVSFSAQIGTLPFTLAYFHKFSVSALFANLLIIPLSGLIIYGGIITLIAVLIGGWSAAIFASANSFLSQITISIVAFFGKSGSSYIEINQFSFYDALLYYIGLVTLIYILKNFSATGAKITAVTFAAVALFFFMSFDNYSLAKNGELTVIGVDVGQGDATLIKFPNGQTALIDAGNAYKNFSNGDKVILPLMTRLDMDFIDYAFITHLDADHYYGIYKLIEKGKIGTVFKPPADSLNKTDLKFENFLKRNNCTIIHFGKESFSIGNARLYFFNSPFLYEGEKNNSNSRSMILKLVYGANSFLFTGDADRQIEKKLTLAAGHFLKSDVLKAGHHGSKNSSLPEFIDKAKPEYVFISAGIENRFRHPSPEVLKLFFESGVQVFRTDKTGAVIITSDGRKISFIDWQKKESRFIFDL